MAPKSGLLINLMSVEYEEQTSARIANIFVSGTDFCTISVAVNSC